MPSSLHILLASVVIGLDAPALSRPIADDQRFWSADIRTTQCFTEQAASAADCQVLLANPPSADWTNFAPSGAPPVFNPFCSGSCCIFTDTPDMPIEDLVSAGNTLMGCIQPANLLLNGVTKIESGSVCIADPTAANSCFNL
ncbi:hypothetical protein K438DRAFT_1969258 [Mycena galopus ATCC 62051]|nr:hypothetical protein K438DRAFT_1969258 [Mycena galopus ATCC 62051]